MFDPLNKTGNMGRKRGLEEKREEVKEGKRKERVFSVAEPSQQESNQFNSVASKPCKKGLNGPLRITTFKSIYS